MHEYKTHLPFVLDASWSFFLILFHDIKKEKAFYLLEPIDPDLAHLMDKLSEKMGKKAQIGYFSKSLCFNVGYCQKGSCFNVGYLSKSSCLNVGPTRVSHNF